MKVTMRKDLVDEGINIPCLYQEGGYLDSSTIAEATYLGTLNGEGNEVVLQLARGQGGYSEIVIVMSIDLDYIHEEDSNE